MPAALLLQTRNPPRQLAHVLNLPVRHPHHPPHLHLPAHVADQETHQLDKVEPVRLLPPRPPRHLDRGAVHHHVLNTVAHKRPVQPEPVPPRLVAAHHARVGRKTQLALRRRDLRHQLRHVPRPNPALAPPAPRRGEQHPPAPRRKLLRHVQNLAATANLTAAGRLGRHRKSSVPSPRELGGYSGDPICIEFTISNPTYFFTFLRISVRVASSRARSLGEKTSGEKSSGSKIGRSSHSPLPSTSRKRVVQWIASSIDFTWNRA